MLLKKLPETYQQNTLMSQVAKLFEDKKIIFASSVLLENGKMRIIKKTSGKPIFDKDRPLYSMIRGISRTIITTGTFSSYFKKITSNLKKTLSRFILPVETKTSKRCTIPSDKSKNKTFLFSQTGKRKKSLHSSTAICTTWLAHKV